MSAEAIHLLGLPKKHTLTADQIADIYLAGVADKHALAWDGALSKWRNQEVKYLLQELLTASLLVKEVLASRIGIRNVGDTEYRDIGVRRGYFGDWFEVGPVPTHYTGVGCMIDGGTTYYTPLWVEAERYQAVMDFVVKNRATADVLNKAGFNLLLNTTTATRYAVGLTGSFDPIADATRTSIATITGARSGSFINFLKFIGGRPIFPNPTVPASAGATGEAGEIAWDTAYFYVCVATNTWKRVALSSW